MFWDLGLEDKQSYQEETAQAIVHALVGKGLETRVMDHLQQLQQDTAVTYDSRNVSLEKKKRDAEDVMRHMCVGYKKPCMVSEEDYASDRISSVTKEYSFLYALELAVRAGKPIEPFLDGQDLVDPLLLREKLYGASSASSKEIYIAGPREPNSHRMPDKIIVYAVDRGAGKRSQMTYEQIASLTAQRMESIGRHGLVPGGVVGGRFHRTLFGSVNRADLCMLNYHQQNQAVVLCPIDRFAQADCTNIFKRSIAVMVDGEKTSGKDIIVTSSPGEKLPAVAPENLVIVAPATMTIARHHAVIIKYDPSQWNIHQINEWLQTTPEGNTVLEQALRRNMDDITKMSK